MWLRCLTNSVYRTPRQCETGPKRRNALPIKRAVPNNLLLVNDMAAVYHARRRNIPDSPRLEPHSHTKSTPSQAGCPLQGISANSITFVRSWPRLPNPSRARKLPSDLRARPVTT